MRTRHRDPDGGSFETRILPPQGPLYSNGLFRIFVDHTVQFSQSAHSRKDKSRKPAQNTPRHNAHNHQQPPTTAGQRQPTESWRARKVAERDRLEGRLLRTRWQCRCVFDRESPPTIDLPSRWYLPNRLCVCHCDPAVSSGMRVSHGTARPNAAPLAYVIERLLCLWRACCVYLTEHLPSL